MYYNKHGIMEVACHNNELDEKTPILIGTNLEDYYDSAIFSNSAIDEFNKRCLLKDSKFEPVEQDDFTNYKNHTMVEVVMELGIKNAIIPNGRTFQIGYIHTKYKNYIIRTVNESLGFEEIDYDMERYKLDEISKICKNTEYFMNTKINKIQNIIDTDLYKDLWLYGNTSRI